MQEAVEVRVLDGDAVSLLDCVLVVETDNVAVPDGVLVGVIDELGVRVSVVV